MKKVLKKFLLIRRIKDGLFATRYFNQKYFQILRWMIYSKEDTNFTYDLTKQNLDELYKLLESIFEVNYSKIKDYSKELLNNSTIKDYLKNKIEASDFKNFADNEIKFSRRIGWYIIARIIKPKTIIETGVDKGMGSVILSEALIKNEKEGFKGKYFGTDINPEAGYLFDDIFRKKGKIIYGDSIETLKKFDEPIDLFINDSDHSAKYEANEYKTVINKLSKNSVILGDNSHSADELLKFSIEHGRNFVLFRERPKNHWYPGAGIGISFMKK
jgi:predicted O-methyltransferase YrrM